MKPLDSKLRDLLAGRYALGVMQAGARLRFEAWLRYDPNLRQLTQRWERQLDGLNAGLEPVVPPVSVWQAIQRRVVPATKRNESVTASGFSVGQLRGWRSLALFASLTAVMLGGWIVAPRDAVPPPMNLAVLTGASGATYLMCNDPISRKAAFEVLADAAIPDDKDAELWLLPANGAPQSMGLLPRKGRMVKTVSVEILAQFGTAKGLAVSIEPKGGSPTGSPTGPIPFQGKLINLWTKPASTTTTVAYQPPMKSPMKSMSPPSRSTAEVLSAVSGVENKAIDTLSGVSVESILRLQQVLRDSQTNAGGEV